MAQRTLQVQTRRPGLNLPDLPFPLLSAGAEVDGEDGGATEGGATGGDATEGGAVVGAAVVEAVVVEICMLGDGGSCGRSEEAVELYISSAALLIDQTTPWLVMDRFLLAVN